MSCQTRLQFLCATLLVISLTACGGGGGGGADPASSSTPSAPAQSAPPPVSTGPVVTGTATKAALQQADIDLLPIDTSGAVSGQSLVTTSTDNEGEFVVAVQPAAVLVRSSGGSYLDEADREPVQAERRRITLAANEGLESLLPAGATTVAVTVVTQALLDKTRREAPTGLFLQQFDANRQLFASAFGFDVITTLPADPVAPAAGSTQQQLQYAMVLGGMANLINRISIDAGFTEPNIETILAAALDLSDGQVDGLVEGTPVQVAGEPIRPFSLNAEIGRFYNNNFNTYDGTPLITVNESVLSSGATSLNVTLSGVTEPAAAVTATVDDSAGGGGVMQFNTVAAADGSFSFDLDPAQASGFVSLAATAAGDPAVIFRSLPGSVAALFAAAGTDGIVDGSELSAANLNSLTTAAAVLAEEANGGAILDDQTLTQALAAINSSVMIRLAAGLEVIIDPPLDIALPDAITNTLGFLADPAIRSDVLNLFDTLTPDAMEQAYASAELVRIPFAAEELSVIYTTVHGNLNNSVVGTELRFNPDGTGTFAGGSGSTSTTWSVDASGDIVVNYDTPFVSEFLCCFEINQDGVEQVDTIDRARIQRFYSGGEAAVADHVLVLNHTISSFPNGELPTTDFDAMPGSATARLAVKQTIPFVAADLAGTGRAAFFHHQDNASESFGPAEFGFDTLDLVADGSGTSRRRQLPFNWSVDADGVLDVLFASGDRNRFVALVPEDDGVLNTLLLATPAAGPPFADRSLVVTRDETQAFDLTTAQDTRFRSFGATGGTFDPQFELQDFDFVFSPGGRACRIPPSSTTWSWTAPAGRIDILRNLSSGELFSARSWEPMRAGNGGFWINELLQFPQGAPLDPAVTPGRHAFYFQEQNLVGNILPQAGDDSIVAEPGEGLSILFNTLLSNDGDVEGDQLRLLTSDTTSSAGLPLTEIVTAGFATVGFSYSPPPGWIGSDTFTYSITDRFCDDPSLSRVTFTVNELDTDILIRGSGSYDLTDAVYNGTAIVNGNINPSAGVVVGGSLTTVDVYLLTSSAGPFGSSGRLDGSSVTGDAFGIEIPFLFVPAGYGSGQQLSGTTLIAQQSFASLGIAPGIYDYEIPNASTRLIVGDVTPPEQATVTITTGSGFVTMDYRATCQDNALGQSFRQCSGVGLVNGDPISASITLDLTAAPVSTTLSSTDVLAWSVNMGTASVSSMDTDNWRFDASFNAAGGVDFMQLLGSAGVAAPDPTPGPTVDLRADIAFGTGAGLCVDPNFAPQPCEIAAFFGGATAEGAGPVKTISFRVVP